MSEEHARPIQIDTENVIAREVEGEIVILDLHHQRYIGGNRSATVLWPLLERGASREELTAGLLDQFGLGREQAEADVRAFIEQLSELGLVQAT